MERYRKELGVLILTGEYQPETPRIDELAMDGLREDDEVIDAEYREVEPEEAESEIDDYAIPDEPESYASNRTVKVANSHEDAHEESNEAYVSAYGMTPQETADEDRMITQAEYGAEIEAETTEKIHQSFSILHRLIMPSVLQSLMKTCVMRRRFL